MKQSMLMAVGVVTASLLGACELQEEQDPTLSTDVGAGEATSLVDQVRALAAEKNIKPLGGPPAVRPALVTLGQALLFDKELSGNRDISCATCHWPTLGTTDRIPLSIGQGGTGLGVNRTHPTMARIPRNAPPLYNLQFMTHLFWDGRVSLVNNTLRTPAGDQLTKEMRDVFEFGAISALALFPITSREEMRGFAGNDLAVVADGDFTGIWRAVMTRLGKIPAYRQMFEAAYPGRTFDTMSAAHMSNAIAGFLVARMTFNNSRWDRFLRGENAALSTLELEGANNFLQARCTLCHSGTLLSDNGFHNVALAQFGPGQGDGPSGRDDFGRARVAGATCSTVDPGTGRRVSTSCRYAFRTPPLRNVDLSGPFGHAGQFASLTDFIDHYSESESKLRNYDPSQLPSDLRGTLLANFDDIMATRDPILSGVVFPGFAKASITQFMTAFTDDAAKSTASSMIPSSVPSGLPVSN